MWRELEGSSLQISINSWIQYSLVQCLLHLQLSKTKESNIYCLSSNAFNGKPWDEQFFSQKKSMSAYSSKCESYDGKITPFSCLSGWKLTDPVKFWISLNRESLSGSDRHWAFRCWTLRLFERWGFWHLEVLAVGFFWKLGFFDVGGFGCWWFWPLKVLDVGGFGRWESWTLWVLEVEGFGRWGF